MRLVRVEMIKSLGEGSYGHVDLVSVTPHATPGPSRKVARKWTYLENSDSNQKESRILDEFADCTRIVKFIGDEIRFRKEENSFVHEMYLEFADGGTLLDVMRRSGGRIVDVDQVRAYTRMILEGLESVHTMGYVHCDIKPENILAFSGDRVPWELKLADFGMAKEPSDGTIAWEPKGTPGYQSPDSMTGVITPAMDIWALGCVVYEMLTGRMLWDDLDREEIQDELAFVEKTPEMPKDLCDVGTHFLGLCFRMNRFHRPSASMLLTHPWISD